MLPLSRLSRAAALLPCLLLPAVAHAAQPPAGNFYTLTVTTSFEPAFTDCWSFASNGAAIYSPRLKHFPYQLTNLNKTPNHLQALWQGHVSIGFSAAISGTNFTGDAVDAYGRTYSMAGSQVTSCKGQTIVGPGFVTR